MIIHIQHYIVMSDHKNDINLFLHRTIHSNESLLIYSSILMRTRLLDLVSTGRRV